MNTVISGQPQFWMEAGKLSSANKYNRTTDKVLAVNLVDIDPYSKFHIQEHSLDQNRMKNVKEKKGFRAVSTSDHF